MADRARSDPYGSARRRIRMTGPAGPVWVGCSCDSQYCMAPAAHPIDQDWPEHPVITAAEGRNAVDDQPVVEPEPRMWDLGALQRHLRERDTPAVYRLMRELWDLPAMREHLRGRDFPGVYRLLEHEGVSQDVIVALTGYDQQDVAAIVAGREVTAYDELRWLGISLGVPLYLMCMCCGDGNWFDCPCAPVFAGPRPDGDSWPGDSRNGDAPA